MDKIKDVERIEMRTKHGDAIALLKYEEVIMPPILLTDPVQKLKDISALEYREGDVIVCSYPKCGWHWVGTMLLKLRGEKIDNSKRMFTGLEFDTSETVSSLASPRLIMTHLWPKRIPDDHMTSCGKTILLLRNPKDVAVSFFYHLKDAVAMSNKQTWDEYFDSFLEGSFLFGSYVEYLRAWSKELIGTGRGLSVEVFFYEDFITDCSSQLKRLAKFLGSEKSEEDLRDIVESCSIAKLKALSREVTQHETLLNKDGHSVIYRKGTVGDWKTHFTVAQHEQLDSRIESTGVDKLYKFKYVV